MFNAFSVPAQRRPDAGGLGVVDARRSTSRNSSSIDRGASVLRDPDALSHYSRRAEINDRAYAAHRARHDGEPGTRCDTRAAGPAMTGIHPPERVSAAAVTGTPVEGQSPRRPNAWLQLVPRTRGTAEPAGVETSAPAHPFRCRDDRGWPVLEREPDAPRLASAIVWCGILAYIGLLLWALSIPVRIAAGR